MATRTTTKTTPAKATTARTTTAKATTAKATLPATKRTTAKPKPPVEDLGLPVCPACGYEFKDPKRRGSCSSKTACAKRRAEARG